MPTRKVTAGVAIGIPLGVLVVWVLNALFLPSIGHEGALPGEVATAIGSVVSFAAADHVFERA